MTNSIFELTKMRKTNFCHQPHCKLLTLHSNMNSWQRFSEPFFWNSTRKQQFLSKITKRIFVNIIWLHTSWKNVTLFVSVYSQIANYQLFRSFKISKHGSLSWVNRSSETHHENTLFIQNSQIEFLSTKCDSIHPRKNLNLFVSVLLTNS